MQVRKPEYYDSFHCIAGACPDTCCSSWCVNVDEKTKAFYLSLPGECGTLIRECLQTDEEGGDYIAFRDGRCPLLDGEGLCRLQRSFGEQALSEVCNRYPRFRYEFGGTAELGVSLSCPESARLILTSGAALREERNTEPPSLNDIDGDRYMAFLSGRKIALGIAGDSTLPVTVRMQQLLLFADGLDRSPYEPEEVLSIWRSPETRPAAPAALKLSRRAAAEKFNSLLDGLEWLKVENRTRFVREGVPCLPAGSTAAERLLEYYIWKYWLQSAYDGRLLRRMQYAAVSMLVIGRACRSESPEQLADTAYRWSRETEHSEQNLELLYSRGGRRRQRLLLTLLEQ